MARLDVKGKSNLTDAVASKREKTEEGDRGERMVVLQVRHGRDGLIGWIRTLFVGGKRGQQG